MSEGPEGARAVFVLEDPSPLRKHLVKLPGGDFWLWRWSCLRGAGFPLALLEQLATPECARLAHDLLALEEETGERRREYVEAIRSQMDAAGNSERRKELASLLTGLNKGKHFDSQDPSLEPLRLQFSASVTRVDDAREAFQNAFQIAVSETSARIAGIAASPRFRRAVMLQNRKVVHFGMELPGFQELAAYHRTKKERQREELVASYLQRYCAKNDSIGFFGPVGWVRFVTEGDALVVQPGRALVAKSSVYFESWAIDSLAQKLSSNPALRPWMCPRVVPDVLLEDNLLSLPDGSSMMISPNDKALLQRCAGRQTARAIAAELAGSATSHREQDVYAKLEKFLAQRVITWSFDVPFALFPEQLLQSRLEHIEDVELRTPALEALDRLARAKDQVRAALEDVDRLDKALLELESTFSNVTGIPPTRNDGEVYAGRTLVYPECFRDLHMEIGPAVLEGLGPPLSLLLKSARWFTYHSATLYRKAFEETYRELAGQRGNARVDFRLFFNKARRLLLSPPHHLFRRLLPEFQRRWAEILRLPEGHRVKYSAAALKDAVETAFAAPHPGWTMARHHSPDVMIAAQSVDAIRRGDYQFILGEIHMATNSVRPAWAMSQHPHPEEMFEAIEADIPEPGIVLVPPKSMARNSGRTRQFLTSSQDHLVELRADSHSWYPPHKTFPISAFVVEQGPQGLTVGTRDGSLRFDVVEFFGEVLSNQAAEYMDILVPQSHIPRITIDQMVIRRESWSFPPSDLPFPQAKSESDRYLQVRCWQRKHQLPRFAFVRVPVELKPVYVDFESPTYAEIFAKLVRRTLASKQASQEPVWVVEMLPTSEGTWLPDSDGQKCTCEFRIVTVDSAR